MPMEYRYQVIYLDSVTDFLKELSTALEAKILASASKMREGDFHSPRIKTIRGPIKELIVKQYRVLFFVHENSIYFVRAFRKKTAKTPRGKIEYAERVYKMVTAY